MGKRLRICKRFSYGKGVLGGECGGGPGRDGSEGAGAGMECDESAENHRCPEDMGTGDGHIPDVGRIHFEAGPVAEDAGNAEGELKGNGGNQQVGGNADEGNIGGVLTNASPEDPGHDENGGSQGDVGDNEGEEEGFAVAYSGSEDDLTVGSSQDKEGVVGDGNEGGMIEGTQGLDFGPGAGVEHGEGDNGDEEGLGHAGMEHGDIDAAVGVDDKTTENALTYDESHSEPGETAHDFSAFGKKSKGGEGHDEQAEHHALDAMRVFIEDSAHHLIKAWVPATDKLGPCGVAEGRFIAGYESSGEDHEEGGEDGDFGENSQRSGCWVGCFCWKHWA